MLVYFPEKCDPGLAETSELSYGLLVPSQFEWYGAVSGHFLQPGGRSWDSKLHHDSITRKHNIVNIEHGSR